MKKRATVEQLHQLGEDVKCIRELSQRVRISTKFATEAEDELRRAQDIWDDVLSEIAIAIEAKDKLAHVKIMARMLPEQPTTDAEPASTWHQLGVLAKQMRDLSQQVCITSYNEVAGSSRITKLLDKADKVLGKVRCILDSAYFAEVKTGDNSVKTQVFYGPITKEAM